MNRFPRISFGIIVLNGEPFTRYCLRSIYPFAHQIIVVEGATQGAFGIATPNGHSADDTLNALKSYKTSHDPDNKLIIVTAESNGHPDGFWPGEKLEMSQAYAQRATGDYLWQVDIDEFYKAEDMRVVLKLLGENSEIAALSFQTKTFWGGFEYITDGMFLKRGDEIFHRLFKWGQGYQYAAHRPPTVLDNKGRNLRDLKWVTGSDLSKKGIFLYHYAFLLPKQVKEKCEYYGNAKWARRALSRKWAIDTFDKLRNPYRAHNVYNYLSWIERFIGKHPKQIEMLRSDLLAGNIDAIMRPTDDIELLLNSKRYRFGRVILRALIPFNRLFHFVKFCTLLLLKNPYRVANSFKLRLQQLAAKRL